MFRSDLEHSSERAATEPFAMLQSDADLSTANITVYERSESAGSVTLETTAHDQVIFRDTATASSANIINNGGGTNFQDNSTAASASLTANEGGHIGFGGSSTAADSRIVVNGGGRLTFAETATAGAAVITDNSATRFVGRSTADNAVITVNGTGQLSFEENSHAGISRIANSGNTDFSGSASLEGAHLINNQGGNIGFTGNSDGGTTSFIANSGAVTFSDSSSLNNGSITTNETGRLLFSGSSSAGTGFISSSGVLAFIENSSAGSAEIIGNADSTIYFADSATAADARIAGETRLRFSGRSSASNSSIVMAAGSEISFHEEATGGIARLQLDAGSALDISEAAGQVGLGTLSGAGVVRLGGRTLAVGDDSPLVDFAGTFSDGGLGGGLVKRGSGVLNLSGRSDYSGTTHLVGGTLQAGAEQSFSVNSTYEVQRGTSLDLAAFDQTVGALAGAGVVDLASATLTVGGSGTSSDFAGSIVGTGGLRKLGAGELLLSGTSTYSGATSVVHGALRVDGSIADSAVVISPRAALSGFGTVGPTLIAGTLDASPANRSLHVIGDLTFISTGEMVVDVNGARAGGVNVTETAYLGGQLSVRPSGMITPATNIGIIQAGAIDSTFQSITSDLAFLSPEAIYGTTTVDLRFERNDVTFNTVAATPNQRATARAVEALGGSNDVYDAVLQMNGSSAQSAFDNLSGEGHSNALAAIAATRSHVRQTVLARLRERNETESNAWSAMQGSINRNPGDGNGAEADFRNVSLLGGIDLRPNSSLTVGIYGSHGQSILDNSMRRTQGSVDTTSVGVTGNWKHQNLRARGGVEVARHQVSLLREISVGPLASTAVSDYSAWSASVFGEVGYAVDVAGMSIEPYLGVAHYLARTSGFVESGAGGANLSATANHVSRTDVEVGVRASGAYLMKNGVQLKPSVSVAYSRNLEGGLSTSRHSFGGAEPFAVSSARTSEDAAVVEARVDVDFSEQFEAGLFYRGTWMKHADSHTLGGSLTYKF